MKQSKMLLPAIIMAGIVMRIPFTTLPVVLTQIAQGLGVSVASLGTLTTIPLVMFALGSSFAPYLAQKIGLEKTFAVVILIMALGSGLRLINVATLYVGTMIVGLAIAFINVLFPSLLLENYPRSFGVYTTIYTTAMGLASTIASAVAVPIVTQTSWQFLIFLLSVIILLAALTWWPNIKNNHYLTLAKTDTVEPTSIWTNKMAWVTLIFSGFQSLLFYTGLTWLPTMALDAGLNQNASGLLAGLYSLISLPLSALIPVIVSRQKRQARRNFMLIFAICGILAMVLLLMGNSRSFWFWSAVNVLWGASVGALFPYMLTAFSLKTTNPTQTARLSGMAQTGGYLLAALGPALCGYGYSYFHSWTPIVFVLLLVTLITTLSLIIMESREKIA